MPKILERGGGGGGGGGCNSLFPFPLKILVKTKKKGLHVCRRPIYLPKSSENQKIGDCVLRCPVFTVLLTGDIYQLIGIFQRGRGGGWSVDSAVPPGYPPAIFFAVK